MINKNKNNCVCIYVYYHYYLKKNNKRRGCVGVVTRQLNEKAFSMLDFEMEKQHEVAPIEAPREVVKLLAAFDARMIKNYAVCGR